MRLIVDLCSCNREVDFKALVQSRDAKEKGGSDGCDDKKLPPQRLKSEEPLSAEDERQDASEPGGSDSDGSRRISGRGGGGINKQMDLIQRLERLARLEQTADGAGGDDSSLSGDDFYGSDDSFIDDSELGDQIEKKLGVQSTTTVFGGFFANSGEIETVQRPEYAGQKRKQEEDSAFKVKKKKKKADPVAKFLDEHGDAADDFDPGPEATQHILELEKAASAELEKQSHRATKKWPKDGELDRLLSRVDKAVVAAHSKGHRTNGYFARLMQFLPFSKTVLKGAMQRLEKLGEVEAARVRLDARLARLRGLLRACAEQQTELPASTEERSPTAATSAAASAAAPEGGPPMATAAMAVDAAAAAANVKPDAVKKEKPPQVKLDVETKESIYHTMNSVEEWVEAFNVYQGARGAQAEDELSKQKERTKALQQIQSMWPDDCVLKLEVPELRRQLQNEKNRQMRKAKARAEQKKEDEPQGLGQGQGQAGGLLAGVPHKKGSDSGGCSASESSSNGSSRGSGSGKGSVVSPTARNQASSSRLSSTSAKQVKKEMLATQAAGTRPNPNKSSGQVGHGRRAKACKIDKIQSSTFYDPPVFRKEDFQVAAASAPAS